jgi:uncharacterized lipoprotein YddW (UPF0748 family)
LDLSKPEDQAKMQKLNFQASQIQTMMTQISKMLKDIEDLLKQIVANS